MTFPNQFSFEAVLSIGFLALGTITLAHPATASGKLPSYLVSQTASSPVPANPPKFVLTEAQKTQIRAVNQKTKAQIVALLTPEQQAVIQKSAQTSPGQRPLATDLKLTPKQQVKIREIEEQGRKQIEALLTPEQLEIIRSQATP